MSLYKIIRHPEVEQDLFDILDLIANYSGTSVALSKLKEIEKTINDLAVTPHIGSLRDEVAPDLRAIPTARKGVVCFIVDDAAFEVRIVAIAYAGREWSLQVNNRFVK